MLEPLCGGRSGHCSGGGPTRRNADVLQSFKGTAGWLGTSWTGLDFRLVDLTRNAHNESGGSACALRHRHAPLYIVSGNAEEERNLRAPFILLIGVLLLLLNQRVEKRNQITDKEEEGGHAINIDLSEHFSA
ncbi:hypothetical protein EYF80_029688 [Liparis tanakae]|uniref:Uncharacterized protein n=1 Tax=Liparis tanakae TaxID=230148 RepID=A0A4Z2H2W7_9TELE|nr:hypothetical protein EYF80_029688 [Liparis tanakae]